MNVAVFATSYFPSVEYFYNIVRFDKIYIEAYEHFPKQTNRNRTHILAPNGVQTLSIPLVQMHKKVLAKDVEIDLQANWKTQHWRSIVTAYNRSAFFEFFKDKLEKVFFEEEKNLLQFNRALANTILLILKEKIEIDFTATYQKETENDLRAISDKKNNTASTELNFKKYPQVFSTKFPFAPNLSILDLLFNCGNEGLRKSF